MSILDENNFHKFKNKVKKMIAEALTALESPASVNVGDIFYMYFDDRDMRDLEFYKVIGVEKDGTATFQQISKSPSGSTKNGIFYVPIPEKPTKIFPVKKNVHFDRFGNAFSRLTAYSTAYRWDERPVIEKKPARDL